MSWKLKDLMTHETSTQINGKWMPARPINWKYRTLREKLKDAWSAFTGKADTFLWPGGQ
jgi:hypothetical protein